MPVALRGEWQGPLQFKPVATHKPVIENFISEGDLITMCLKLAMYPSANLNGRATEMLSIIFSKDSWHVLAYLL